MFLRSRSLLCACSAVLTSAASAQEDTPSAQNAVFLEGLGQGIYWSANYEGTQYASRAVAFHMRVGLGAWSTDELSGFFTVPGTFSISAGGDHRVEAGGGFTFYSFTSGRAGRTSEILFPTIHGGYRYQRADGGLLLRLGVMFANVEDKAGFRYDAEGWAFNPHISVGYVIKR